MSKKISNTKVQNSYFKNNKIRSNLLLFIDNEIRSKIKQNNRNLKFKCEDENLFRISFEETFNQKENNKYDFLSPNILKTKKNDNSDKSFSTIDDSPNKINKKQYQKKRNNTHFRTFSKENNCSNKLLNTFICFDKKNYSIKNLLKQSSTFLILPRKKNAANYLKTLCNNLKICKKDKKPAKHNISCITKSELFEINKDKKLSKKSNELNLQKSKKDKHYSYSLFRKQQKNNFVFNSEDRISSNLILIEIK